VKEGRKLLPARASRVAALASIVALVVAAGACSSSGSSSTGNSGTTTGDATKSPIDVGLITTLTSTTLTTSPQVAVAQKAAVAYINSTGGINGHPLVANQCDDQNQPNQAAACAQAAVRSSDVAVVGATEIFPAVFSVLSSAKMVFTAGLGLTPQELQSPTSFPITSAGVGWYVGMGALAVKLGAKQITIVQCNVPACAQTADASAEGLKIAGDTAPPKYVTYQLGQAITAADAQQVINQKPDAVLVAGPGPYPQELMTALHQAGYTGKIINNIGSFNAPAIQAVGNTVADGSYVVSTLRLATQTNVPAVALFDKWMNQTDPKALKDELSLMEWTGMLIFAQIAKSLPDVTRTAVLQAYQHLQTPVNVGTSAPFSVVGNPSPISTFPQLHSKDVMYSVVKNGQFVPLGGFVNPFAPPGQ
jgi:branched-chain amino acid transport system substrate-binding protein